MVMSPTSTSTPRNERMNGWTQACADVCARARVLDVGGMEVQFGDVAQLVLTADSLLVHVLISAHPFLNDHLLYLAQVLEAALDVSLHSRVAVLPFRGDIFCLHDVLPQSHLLIYVTDSFHPSLLLSYLRR